MSRESILERNRKRAQENDQKMGATALGTSALNYSTQQSLERAAAEKVARESAGGLVDVPQPWLDTITTVTPSRQSRPASLYDLTIGSAMRGYQNARYGEELYDKMMGRENESEVLARELSSERYSFEPDGFLQSALSGAAELLGQQFRQISNPESVAVGAAGAGAAALAGQAGPQVLLPEEVITVPAGFLAGMKLGSANNSLQIEAGLAYQEMLDNGISEETARTVAMGVGGVNAALDLLQLDELVKSFRVLDKSGAGDTVLDAIGQELLRRGVDVAKETGQEVAQEGVTIAGNQIAGQLDQGDWVYDSDEVLSRLGDTALSSALAFGVLNVPGGVYHLATRDRAPSVNSDSAGGVVNSDTTTAIEAPEAQGNGQNTVQNDSIPETTRQAVEMLVSGQEITGGQAERIARSPEAVALLSQLTGTEVNTDAPLSQVKADIRAVAGTRAASGTVSGQGQETAQTSQGTAPVVPQTERTTAQRVHDVNRVRGAASSMGMGESGQRAISAAYDGSVDADRYYAGFTAYYEAGLSGRAREQVRSDYAADLTEAQRFAAYTAGQNDAAASLQREKLAAQFSQTAGADSGLVYDDFVREAVESGRTVSGENGSGPVYLTQETAERVNSVAKALGLRVRFVDQVDGGRSNAEIAGSEVQIEKNNPLPVQFLMGHEVTHRLQELAPEEYRAFREAAAQDEMVQTYVRRYAEGDSGLTYEQALDEAAADYAGRLLEDGELLDQFIGRNQDNRTLLEKVRDAIRTLVRRLTGAEKKAAQTAEGKLSAALEAGAKRAETLQERQGDGTMESRYSRKEDGANGREGTEQTAEGSSGENYAGRAQGSRENNAEAGGAGILPSVRMLSRGEKPVRQWAERGLTVPEPGSVSESEAKVVFDEYRLPVFVVKSDIFNQNHPTAPAFSSEGQVFLREDLPEIGRGDIGAHEAGHVMKQVGYVPYLKFIEKTPELMNRQSPICIRLMEHAAKHNKVELFNMSEQDAIDLYDEINNMVYGAIHAGRTETLELVRSAFYDFDTYAAELTQIHEQFKRERGGTQARESRKGFSVDRELDREIRQIVKEAREGGRSEEAVQADIRELVQESYQRMAEQYGTIPAGERPAREVRVPRRTAEERVVSQTVRTVLEAGATPEAAIPNIEELTARGVFSYTRYTDKQAISDAENEISGPNGIGWDKAQREWFQDVQKGNVSKANTAMGWVLYNNAVNNGNIELAMDILTNMVEHQRNAAQAVQATRILKQLSPDAQLYGVERSVRNLQKELTRKYGKNAPDLKIDEELAGRFLSARTQKARDEAMQELYRDIGRQMPSRFVDKWNAWRYLAMLGNPRTHVRNVVGNAFFAPVVATKNLTATAIEAAAARVSRGRMGRSKRLVGFGKKDRALLSAAWADFANVEEQILGSGKYSDSANANRYIQEGRVIFRNKALETARRGNSAALDLEDTWFSKPHYAYALAQYAKANGLTAAQLRNGRGLDGARAYAIREAQKATYRDTNYFSQLISSAGRYRGDNPVGTVGSVVLEGILPFRRTPANILVRGVEYSPLGLLKSLTYDLAQVKRGKKEAWEAIDGIAAGLTGTGLMALGVLLAAEGLVRGSGGGDDDENQYEELMGHQAYALEVGGQSYTLDWLAPESLPFFVGVNLWEQSGAEEEVPTLSTMINAIGNVTEPLLEMSCLQSLNEVFDAVGYATSEGLGALPSALVSAATSYLTQAVPTILGQAERTSQGERMTTYTEKNAFLTQDMQYTLGSISGRTPGWDYQQIPYIDAWGRTESTGSTAARALDNFLNPAYRSTIEESPMELALQELYEQTGEGAVLPSRAPRYFNVDGERKDLTAGEYVEYASARGQTAYVLMEELFQRTEGAGLSDEDMVNAVERVYEYANAQAKTLVSDYEPDGWVKKAMDGAASGVSPVDYTLYELAKEMADAENSDPEKRNGSIDQAEAEAAIDMLTGLSDEARAYLWQSTNKGWKESNNPYR